MIFRNFRAVPSRQKQISSGLLVGMSLIHVFWRTETPSQDKFFHASFGCTCQKGPGSLQTAAMDFYTSLWSPNKCSVALSPTWILKQPLEVFTGPHPHWQGIYLQKERASPSLSLARKYAFVDWIFDKSAVIKLSAMSSHGSNLILSFRNWKIVCLPLIPIHRACQTSLLT